MFADIAADHYMSSDIVAVHSNTPAELAADRSVRGTAEHSTDNTRRTLRNNKVGPVEVSGTQTPYIIDFKVIMVLFIIFLFIGFLVYVVASPDKSWINLYIVNLFTFIGIVYWVHSSQEISEYAMRKLIQLFGNNM